VPRERRGGGLRNAQHEDDGHVGPFLLIAGEPAAGPIRRSISVAPGGAEGNRFSAIPATWVVIRVR